MAESFLQTAVKRVRLALDEPTQDAKYTDAVVVRDFIEPAYGIVLTDINRGSTSRTYLRYDFTITADQEFYRLPGNFGRLWRLARFNSNLELLNDWYPASQMHPYGPGWLINGRELQLKPIPKFTETWTILYSPAEELRLHVGQGTKGTGTDELILDSSPTLGTLDKRDNAYAGANLRILEDGNNDIEQDHTVATYDPADAQGLLATTRRPFDPALSASSEAIKYEFVPPIGLPLLHSISLRAALMMQSYKGGQQTKRDDLKEEYRDAIRIAREQLQHANSRISTGGQSLTIDADDPHGGGLEGIFG